MTDPVRPQGAETYTKCRSRQVPKTRAELKELRALGKSLIDGFRSFFGVVVGAASGALIGFLFVAISVNASRIAKHPALHVVASRTLVLFGIPLVAAILVVTPRQADWALGTELIVLGVVAGAALILVGRGRVDIDASPESRLARTLTARVRPSRPLC